MTRASLVLKGLTRHKLRATLLVVSIASAFLLFGTLFAVKGLLSGEGVSGPAGLLLVSNRVSFTQPLPISYVNKIAALPEVATVSYQTLIAGYYREPKNPLLMLAVDPGTFFAAKSDLVVSDAAAKRFFSERRGVLVGAALLKSQGWHVGDHITVKTGRALQAVGPDTWDFRIVGSFDGRKAHAETRFLLLQYEYLNQARALAKDTVGTILVRGRNTSQTDRLAKRIDDQFQNSASETSTVTEDAFGRAFIKQLGDIALIVTLVVGAAFVSIAMIVGNTMMMSIRERTREIAILKVLGFTPASVMRLILAETALLSFLGGLLGLLLASGVVAGLRAAPGGSFANLHLSGGTVSRGVALMLVLAVLTGALPAAMAMRMSIVRAFGRL